MSEFDRFLSKYPTKKFSKGTMIFHQGDVPTCAYVIKKGVVKNSDLTHAGEEKPIVFDARLDAFPIGWIFFKINRVQYFYEAFTDCEVYIIPREDYMDFLKSHSDSMFDVFDRFITRYLDFQLRINGLSQSRAHDKLLFTLKFLCSRFGTPKAHSDVLIRLRLTQQDIANILGVTRETASTELKKLEQDGFVRYSNQQYIVDTSKVDEALA